MIMKNKILHYISLLFFFLMLTACGEDSYRTAYITEVNSFKNLAQNFESSYKKLEDHVSDRDKKGKYEQMLVLSMANVLKENPEDKNLQDLIRTFNKDRTVDGTLFKTVKDYYSEVKSDPNYNLLVTTPSDKLADRKFDFSIVAQKIAKANSAFNIDVFDNRFVDYINILASLSDKVSPVVVESVNKDAPIGSEFVGNPAYGRWVEKDNGEMEWGFFETYLMLSLLDNDRHYRYNDYDRYHRYTYDNWSRTRNYSYSNDVYANRYASNTTTNKYKNFQASVAKNPKYKDQTYKNPSLDKQKQDVSVKSKSFTPSVAKTPVKDKNTKVDNKSNSHNTTDKTKGTTYKQKGFTPSVAQKPQPKPAPKQKSSGGHNSSSSSRSKVGGK